MKGFSLAGHLSEYKTDTVLLLQEFHLPSFCDWALVVGSPPLDLHKKIFCCCLCSSYSLWSPSPTHESPILSILSILCKVQECLNKKTFFSVPGPIDLDSDFDSVPGFHFDCFLVDDFPHDSYLLDSFLLDEYLANCHYFVPLSCPQSSFARPRKCKYLNHWVCSFF